MNRDELLEEARRRYKPGMECKSATSGSLFVISKEAEFYFSGNDISDKGMHIYDGDSESWAEIVSTPQPQFEEGKWYKNSTGHTIKHKEKLGNKFLHGDYIASDGTFYYNTHNLSCVEDGTYKEV